MDGTSVLQSAIDYTKIEGEIKAFYKPLLDDYNSEIDKANRT